MGGAESHSGSASVSRSLAEGTVQWNSWREHMEACAVSGVNFAVHGLHGEKAGGARKGGVRATESWGESRFGNRFGAKCRRGEKPTPNQDNFFFVEIGDDAFVLGVMDGHGKWGHRYSESVAWWLPMLITRHPAFNDDVPEAVMGAYEQMSKILAAKVTTTIPRHECSGSTCVVVVRRGLSLYIANIGDSRAVLYNAHLTHALSEDHKPDRPIESARIEQHGGKVVDFGANGGGPRLMDKGGTFGLAMSRAFGDAMVQELGLSDVPDLKIYPLDADTEYTLVVGSDGLWDYMSNTDVRSFAWGREVERSVDALVTSSVQRWEASSQGTYVDDITCAIATFTVTGCADRGVQQQKLDVQKASDAGETFLTPDEFKAKFVQTGSGPQPATDLGSANPGGGAAAADACAPADVSHETPSPDEQLQGHNAVEPAPPESVCPNEFLEEPRRTARSEAHIAKRLDKRFDPLGDTPVGDMFGSARGSTPREPAAGFDTAAAAAAATDPSVERAEGSPFD